MVIKLNIPVEDADVVKNLKAGEEVLLTGLMYTARDAAHKRLIDLLDKGEPLPVDLNGGETVTLRLAADADVTAFGALSGAIGATGAPITGPQIALVGALNVRLGPASPPGVGVSAGAAFPAQSQGRSARPPSGPAPWDRP